MPQSHTYKAGENKKTETHCEHVATRMTDGRMFLSIAGSLSHSCYQIIFTYMRGQTQTHIGALITDSTLLLPSMQSRTRRITARGPKSILSKDSRGEEKKENITLRHTWNHIPGDHINPHNHTKWLPPLGTKNIHLNSLTANGENCESQQKLY